jgi:endonuclease YncB( thermonuclease family)
MRRSLVIVAGFAASLGLAALLFLPRPHAPPAADPAHTAAASAPVALPPPPAPAPTATEIADATPAPPPSAAAPPAAAPPAAAPPAAAPAPPQELPTVEVKQRPVHSVPDDTPPPRPVTLLGREALAAAPQAMERRAPPPAPKPKETPAVVIVGAAHADDGVSLTVRGRVVSLFGVRAPQHGDRCAAAPGPSPRACADVARDALAARLSGNATVSCRVPPGQRGGASAAVCLDSTGVDLAGFLVGAGFVLADPAQSYDYVGAESVARSFRRGLWHYR